LPTNRTARAAVPPDHPPVHENAREIVGHHQSSPVQTGWTNAKSGDNRHTALPRFLRPAGRNGGIPSHPTAPLILQSPIAHRLTRNLGDAMTSHVELPMDTSIRAPKFISTNERYTFP